jgi:hypothetical protein
MMRSLFKSAAKIWLIFSLTISMVHAQVDKPSQSQSPNTQGQRTSASSDTRSTSGRIKGSVTGDGGRPVPDASIFIFPVNVGNNLPGAVTSMLRPNTSDADGKFEITSLAPGAYTISASAPGLVSADSDTKIYRPGDTATINLVKGGVITGKVTSSSGEPVVGAMMRVIKVRETDDKPLKTRSSIGTQMSQSFDMMLGPFRTDDRGIYRIYGLTSGYYQVAAGGLGAQGMSFGLSNSYDADAPTYFPSSTLETAAEVTVRAGEESSGIDIRYRENRGHSIGGTVTVSSGPTPKSTTVLLTRANTGIVESSTFILAGRDTFGFDTVMDGEYVVTAMGTSGNFGAITGPEGISASVSTSRRITIKGADVTGVNLTLEPLSSISGRLSLVPIQDPDSVPACKKIRHAPIEGIVISTREENKQSGPDPLLGPLGAFKDTTPSEKGEFTISLVRPGVHHLDMQLPTTSMFVSAITQLQPDNKTIDLSKGLRLKAGDNLKGVNVTVKEGAAGFQGKVVIDPDNKPPTMKVRVHLVPAEKESAEDVLRYFESDVAADGGFSFTNVSPGQYWLVGREPSDPPITESERKPLSWDAGSRAALRLEGEASKKVIELTQCQGVDEYVFKYVPLVRPSKK